MDDRIQGAHVEIDSFETEQFFQNRAKKNVKYLYNKCLYQDDNPQVALLRDKEEKNKILPLLNLDQEDKVLDIGCGVGRWGEEVVKAGALYVGVDYSEDILKLADDNLKGKGDYRLINSSFQNIDEKIKDEHFNKVIISGCLMYINDFELVNAIRNIQSLLLTSSLLYLRETISVDERLTLNHFYSKELQCEYNAIYRTQEEYQKLLTPYFQIQRQGPLYQRNLNIRSETLCYFFIASRK